MNIEQPAPQTTDGTDEPDRVDDEGGQVTGLPVRTGYPAAHHAMVQAWERLASEATLSPQEYCHVLLAEALAHIPDQQPLVDALGASLAGVKDLLEFWDSEQARESRDCLNCGEPIVRTDPFRAPGRRVNSTHVHAATSTAWCEGGGDEIATPSYVFVAAPGEDLRDALAGQPTTVRD